MDFPAQPPVVASAELAQMLGLSEARVRQLMRSEDWPAPIAVLTVGRIWDTGSVRAWCAAHGRVVYPIGKPLP